MGGICDIVGLHRRDGIAWIAVGVLSPHDWGKEQNEVVDGVRGHSQDIQKGKVDGKADCSPTADVEEELRVTGRSPTQHVRPSDDAR